MRLLAAATIALCLNTALHAAPLVPPGAPASTMKTLQEVEPRTPIHASSLPIIIDQSGSYYLAEDIADYDTAQGHAITINTKDFVSIDFNGFKLAAASPAETTTRAIHGIIRGGVRVHNGAIAGFAPASIYLPLSSAVIEEMTIQFATAAIHVGSRSKIASCKLAPVGGIIILKAPALIINAGSEAQVLGNIIGHSTYQMDDFELYAIATGNNALIADNVVGNLTAVAGGPATIIGHVDANDRAVIRSNVFGSISLDSADQGLIMSVSAGNGSSVTDCTIGNLTGTAAARAFGIAVQNGTIRGNNFQDITGPSWVAGLSGGDRSFIQDNVVGKISSANGQLIGIMSHGGVVSGNYLKAVEAENAVGIRAHGDRVAVTGNKIDSVSGLGAPKGIFVNGNRATIISNTVYSDSGTSLVMWGSYNYFAGNLLTNAPDLGGGFQVGNTDGTSPSPNVILPSP